MIDWPLLQNRDFRRDLDDPGKFERYQAEALVYGRCPVGGLLGVFCHSDTVRSELELMINTSGLNLPVYTRPNWYFQ
ncbi:DarT ssDNA thymidine ADP-ribosyltransferase family protein [Saccharospirillum impatiens]|uniref:DarT ssDNA thymidine ADP-ribosyltransferase family protein n=1 Tax=Saccharospirillum impatiens TaxID=169438 RepID=UPI0003FA0E49